MAKLIDLLEGFTGSTANELEAHIQTRAKELKLKLFLDDGDKNIFVPKARLDSEIVKNVELKKTIAENESAMAKLNDLTKDNQKAQDTIAELQGKMDTMKQTLKDTSLSLALKAQALELGAIDETGQDLLAFIEKDKLVINEDGTVTGLSEAVKSLKASKSYLFKQETTGAENTGAGNAGAENIGAGLIGTGSPGRPSTVKVPGSKSVKPGDFGSMLSESFVNNGMGLNLSNVQTSTQPQYDFFK